MHLEAQEMKLKRTECADEQRMSHIAGFNPPLTVTNATVEMTRTFLTKFERYPRRESVHSHFSGSP